jgi:hypothetical protein
VAIGRPFYRLKKSWLDSIGGSSRFRPPLAPIDCVERSQSSPESEDCEVSPIEFATGNRFGN